MRGGTAALLALTAFACGDAPIDDGAAAAPVDITASAPTPPPSVPATPSRAPRVHSWVAASGGHGTTPKLSAERAIAAKLGLPDRFSFGIGNDAAGNDPNAAAGLNLTSPVDIHYMYLSGLPGEGGWTEWNAPEGHYVDIYAQAAKAKSVVPMFTLYQGAAWGEANFSAFADATFMTKYWHGVRVLFERLGTFGSPAIVHVEPDLWGEFQESKGDDPSAATVKVGTIVPECASLSEDVAGFGECVLILARTLAPHAVIGLSASSFGAFTDGASDPIRIADYLKKIGGGSYDIVVVETLDRDAGCFEKAVDPKCKRTGTFYWDESNTTHPNFHDHLAWAKTLRKELGLPLLWWQMPLGVPSTTPGGSAGHYRDNRVHYTFNNAWEFAEAGGIGAVFGTGAGNQTTVSSDGGQFVSSLAAYLATGGNGLN